MKPKIEAVAFRAEHMRLIRKVSRASGGDFPITDDAITVLERGNSFTLLVDDVPVACGGTIEVWKGHYNGWAYISRAAAPHMLRITRYTRQILKSAGPGRITATVVSEFKNGHKWAKLLGFSVETPRLEKYGPLGEDHVGYKLIQD